MRVETVGIEQLTPGRAQLQGRRPAAWMLQRARNGDRLWLPVVRPMGDRRYEIVEGVEVWKAVQIVGRHALEVLVDEDALESDRVVQRTDAVSIAEAWEAERRIRERERGRRVSHRELALELGVNRATLTHGMRLLRMPEVVRERVRSGEIGASHAKVLASLVDRGRVIELAGKAARERWSVRRLAEEARSSGTAEGGSGATDRETIPALEAMMSDPDVCREIERLSEGFGTRVSIDPGSADVTIRCFGSVEAMLGVMEKLARALPRRPEDDLPW